MPFEITEIKPIRKKLGITQNELANISGVSQSLIAKIEADIIDPSYTSVKKIFDAIETMNKEKEPSIELIMNKKIIHAHPKDNAKEVISKMKRHEISQMPVLDDGKAVGTISEAILLDALIENRTGEISGIMKEPPPILSKDTSLKAVSDLLRYYPLVLINQKGKLKGLITKADLLRKVYNKK